MTRLPWLVVVALLWAFASARSAQGSGNVNSSDKPAAEQPIPFSHKRHAALSVPCGECHATKDDGEHLTFPAASKCMLCHVSVASDKPAIQKLAGYAKSGTVIPWVQLYSVPGWVFWSHQTHLDAAVSCQECHGNVSEMDVTAKVTAVTTMAGCVECHRMRKAPVGCNACHEERN